jgi:hypothetical protein
VVAHRRHVTVSARDQDRHRLKRGKPPLGADEIELQGLCHFGSLRRFRGHLLGLGDHIIDAADHVEGGFREVIVWR